MSLVKCAGRSTTPSVRAESGEDAKKKKAVVLVLLVLAVVGSNRHSLSLARG